MAEQELHKAVTLADLAGAAGVSTSTVSRALNRPELVNEAVVQRIREVAREFGYVPNRAGRSLRLRRQPAGDSAPPSDAGYEVREHLRELEKQAIAVAAAQLVEPGRIVGLDSGTTVVALAHELRRISPLTIVTPSIAVAEVFGGVDGITLVVTGGEYLQDTRSLVGPLAEETLLRLSLDIAFLTGYGMSPKTGLMNVHFNTVGVRKALAASSAQVVALTDSTKLARTGLISALAPEDVDVLVSDWKMTADVRGAFEAAGIRVVLGERPAGAPEA